MKHLNLKAASGKREAVLHLAHQRKTSLLVLVSPGPHLHHLLDPEGVSHWQSPPPIPS